jgi:Family of unknown function (DUF6441)
MNLRFALSEVTSGFIDTVAKELQRPMAKAATAASRETGEIAKRNGRASIAAAGFSRKWQNALRVNIYPPQGDSMRPAAFIFHKIRYAGVFEEGAVIGGRPLLWLPLPSVPLRRGRPMAPSQYARSVGPLVAAAPAQAVAPSFSPTGTGRPSACTRTDRGKTKKEGREGCAVQG